MLLRKLCTIIACVWNCLLGLYGKNKDDSNSSRPSHSGDWQSDEWEDFTVSVIPHASESDVDFGKGDSLETTHEHEEKDVFSDMQPVLKKAKKVCSKF